MKIILIIVIYYNIMKSIKAVYFVDNNTSDCRDCDQNNQDAGNYK